MTVVITFNGAVDANDQCAAGEQGGEPRPHGAVQVTASFCGGGRPISSTTDGIGDTTGVGDPQFAALISRVTENLFEQDYHRSPAPGMYIGGGPGGFGIGGGLGIGIGIGRW